MRGRGAEGRGPLFHRNISTGSAFEVSSQSSHGFGLVFVISMGMMWLSTARSTYSPRRLPAGARKGSEAELAAGGDRHRGTNRFAHAEDRRLFQKPQAEDDFRATGLGAGTLSARARRDEKCHNDADAVHGPEG